MITKCSVCQRIFRGSTFDPCVIPICSRSCAEHVRGYVNIARNEEYRRAWARSRRGMTNPCAQIVLDGGGTCNLSIS